MPLDTEDGRSPRFTTDRRKKAVRIESDCVEHDDLLTGKKIKIKRPLHRGPTNKGEYLVNFRLDDKNA